MQDVIQILRQTKTDEECLRAAYDILTAKYHGDRLKTVTRLLGLLPHSAYRLWARSGFMHCTHLNKLLRILLVQSGHFSGDAIRTRWTLLWWFSPHEYAVVTLRDGRQIAVDVWAHVYGIPFGDHAHGWHTGSRK